VKIRVDSIDLDVSIQCRANINTGTVNEYAERMIEGDKFPPVVLFGTEKRSWIGDGRHRIMAALLAERGDVEAAERAGQPIVVGSLYVKRFAAGKAEEVKVILEVPE
jgi:hypothetical protein